MGTVTAAAHGTDSIMLSITGTPPFRIERQLWTEEQTEVFDKILYVGNSLLTGFGSGMAASNPSHDYYALVNTTLLSDSSAATVSRIPGYTWEDATTTAEHTAFYDGVYHSSFASDLDLVIIQLGDNVNTAGKGAVFEDGVRSFIAFVQEHCPHARIIWVGMWYLNSYNSPAINICEELGISYVDISSYSGVANQSYVGAEYIDLDGHTHTITEAGVASHPGDSGFALIANAIIQESLASPPAPVPLDATGFTINHLNTNLNLVPLSAIDTARNTLHIGYGHTSHGQQITLGLEHLPAFAANVNNTRVPYTTTAFQYTGSGGLDLVDYAFTDPIEYLDLGQITGGVLDFTHWEYHTRNYLAANPTRFNVVLWGWCASAFRDSSVTLADITGHYLPLMNDLEIDYPNIKFIYSTSPTPYPFDDSALSGPTGKYHLFNNVIRDYCTTNNKWLYDFEDIECYDPDGNYFLDKWVHDSCEYSTTQSGDHTGNWATEWQALHTQNTDWYFVDDGSGNEIAHTKSLNANLKAYAAWWLFARLAGWTGEIE